MKAGREHGVRASCSEIAGDLYQRGSAREKAKHMYEHTRPTWANVKVYVLDRCVGDSSNHAGCCVEK